MICSAEQHFGSGSPSPCGSRQVYLSSTLSCSLVVIARYTRRWPISHGQTGPDRLTFFTSFLSRLSNLPCLLTTPTEPIRVPADALNIERDAERSLRGLLVEVSGSIDAEMLSLHSTVGTDGRRKKIAGRTRNIFPCQPRRMTI
jgi:hypothetical protein